MTKKRMELQIISDIHVEFWNSKDKFNFITPVAPILILAGDIGCCGADEDFEQYKKFINELLPKYKYIIIIAGNHEYWYNPDERKRPPDITNTMLGVDKKIYNYCKTSPKLHYLNNSSIQLNIGSKKYKICGTTLWTYIPEEQRKGFNKIMNDYKFIYTRDAETKEIRNLSVNDVVKMHVKAVKFLKSEIDESKKIQNGPELIIITHHKPYTSERYNKDPLAYAYESNLKDLMDYPIILWAYGHTHEHDNQRIGKILIYSNPKGYPKQKTLFNKNELVKL